MDLDKMPWTREHPTKPGCYWACKRYHEKCMPVAEIVQVNRALEVYRITQVADGLRLREVRTTLQYFDWYVLEPITVWGVVKFSR